MGLPACMGPAYLGLPTCMGPAYVHSLMPARTHQIYWSPAGHHVVLAGTKNLNGVLNFFNAGKRLSPRFILMSGDFPGFLLVFLGSIFAGVALIMFYRVSRYHKLRHTYACRFSSTI